jgi:copper/silver efflux system protein
MQRIAAPMIGGMLSSTVLTLVVIPAVYSLWKEWQLPDTGGDSGVVTDNAAPAGGILKN